MFRLVADIHLSDIGSFYWQKLQWDAPSCILRTSVNGESTILILASWVIYIPMLGVLPEGTNNGT